MSGRAIRTAKAWDCACLAVHSAPRGRRRAAADGLSAQVAETLRAEVAAAGVVAPVDGWSDPNNGDYE